jgi:hypothetical protein
MSELYEKGARSGYKEIDDVLNLIGKRMEKIWGKEEARGLIQSKITNPYLRHTITGDARKAILEGKDIFTGMSKSLRTNIGAAKPRQVMKTIKEANEWSVKNLGYKMFEEDIFKAWAVREYESIAAIRNFDFLNELGEKFGKSFAPMKKEVRVAKGAVKTKEFYPEKMIDGLKYVTSKSPQLEGMYFPEAIVKQIDATFETLTNEKTLKTFLNAYDKALNFWKGTVTGIWPAFHSRNYIGGTWNNFLEGLMPSRWLGESEKALHGKEGEIVTNFGKRISFKEIRKAYLTRGGAQPGKIDVIREMDEILEAGKVSRKIKDAPMWAMESVENRLRMPLFIDRLVKGDSFDDAMKHVFRAHFDYAPEALTAFERTTMKRIIPFYTWTRNNIPYQLAQLVKQPAKFSALAKTQRDFNSMIPESKEEMKYMPEWMSEMLIFRLPSKEIALYLQLDLPVDDLNKLPLTESGVREILSLMSPMLKYPVEILANRNLYFGSEIYDKDLPEEFRTSGTVKQLRALPEPIKKWLNFKEGVKKDPRSGEFEPYFEMDALKLHTIRTFLGRFYSSFAQALEEDMPIWGKMSRLVGGVPIRKFDVDEEKYRREKEFERLLRDLSNYFKRRQQMPYKSETGIKIPTY